MQGPWRVTSCGECGPSPTGVAAEREPLDEPAVGEAGDRAALEERLDLPDDRRCDGLRHACELPGSWDRSGGRTPMSTHPLAGCCPGVDHRIPEIAPEKRIRPDWLMSAIRHQPGFLLIPRRIVPGCRSSCPGLPGERGERHNALEYRRNLRARPWPRRMPSTSRIKRPGTWAGSLDTPRGSSSMASSSTSAISPHRKRAASKPCVLIRWRRGNFAWATIVSCTMSRKILGREYTAHESDRPSRGQSEP